MSSKLTETPESGAPPDSWRHARETAPSVMSKDDPTFARWLGLVGLMLLTLGSVALGAVAFGAGSRVSPVFAILFCVVGLAGLLFHAAIDTEPQIRRIYGMIGYLWLAAGVLVTVLPIHGQPVGAHFLPYGFICMVLSLLFLLPFARNETAPGWRRLVITLLGVAGAIFAAVGFIGGNISEAFLLGGDAKAPYGLFLVLLGLAYCWAFIGLNGPASEIGYRGSLGLGMVGALILLVALARSILPSLFHSFGWIAARPAPYRLAIEV